MDALVQQIESPFIARVLHFPFPAKFKMPQIETFDGTKNPIDHLNTYKNQMELHEYQDPIQCRAFAITLKGPTLAWFNRLPPSSISSFIELSITFVSHFIGVRTYRKPSYHLLTIKQNSQESLRSYVQIFNAESQILGSSPPLTTSVSHILGSSPPLTTSVSQILREVHHEKFMRWSSQMKSNLAKIDNAKYCEFHRDHGHRTDDYIQLRKEIEYLFRHGHLRRYVASAGQDQVQPPPHHQPTSAQHQLPLGEIHVIFGGFARGGESISARKAHLRSIRSRKTLEIQVVSKLPQLGTTITFLDSDMEGCQHPHDDPLVIRVVVANKTIHRVFFDNESSTDIIFASTFDKIGIISGKLEPVNTYLCGFSGERVLPLGSIRLVLTLGDPPCQATTIVRFLIVDAPSAYNILLGRPSLNTIPSAYHMVIKFQLQMK